jgi:hypothetical protein
MPDAMSVQTVVVDLLACLALEQRDKSPPPAELQGEVRLAVELP